MKQDIKNREDIVKVMFSFYEKVQESKVLSHFFSEVVPINWDLHLTKMCDFWENVLFYTGDYEGDPLVIHRQVNAIYPTKEKHFKVWLKLFESTLYGMYEGENTDKMMKHALSIAMVMQQKI